MIAGRRWRAALLGAIALAVAVGAGVWTGRSAAPAPDAQPAASRVVRVGVASLEVPREWRTVPVQGSRIARRRAPATTVLAPSPRSPDRMIVTVAPADDPSLAPQVLRDLVAEPLGDPRPTRLAGHRAWVYPALRGRKPERMLDLTVLPSSRGVLAIACVSGFGSNAMVDCASSIASVSLRDAAILVPESDLAFRLRLSEVLVRLDTRRVRARAELRRVAAADSRARMARRIAREHAAAADALQPLAGRDGAALVTRLSEAAAAYSVFAGTARSRSKSRFDAASRDVEAADAAVAGAVALLARREVGEVPGPRATPAPGDPAAKGRRWLRLAALLIATLLLAAIAVGVPRLRRRSGGFGSPRDSADLHRGPDLSRRAGASATPPPSVGRAVAHSSPPPPPPARNAFAGRWDGPPAGVSEAALGTAGAAGPEGECWDAATAIGPPRSRR